MSAAICRLAIACTEPTAGPTASPASPPTAATKQAQSSADAVKAEALPSQAQTPAQAPSAAQPANDAVKPPNAAQPTLTHEQMCDGICARSSELRCEKADACPKMCAETMQLHVCEQELEAATRCTLSHPAGDWQCSRQGVASIKDPFCTEEQRAFGKCLIANSPKR